MVEAFFEKPRQLERQHAELYAELAAAQWVAKDSPSIWEWPIFPPGFHSEHLMELARLQAWTIKPAILEGPPQHAVQGA